MVAIQREKKIQKEKKEGKAIRRNVVIQDIKKSRNEQLEIGDDDDDEDKIMIMTKIKMIMIMMKIR